MHTYIHTYIVHTYILQVRIDEKTQSQLAKILNEQMAFEELREWTNQMRLAAQLLLVLFRSYDIDVCTTRLRVTH
jgi:hypothetical protein